MITSFWITVYLLIWLLPIGVNVWVDRDGRKPNYLQVFILRGIAAILHGIYFNPHNMVEYFPVFVFQVTSFWLLFEGALNVIRKKPLLYYDHEEGDSGWIDRFFKWTGPKFHMVAKMFTLLLCILSIIVIYNRF